jgi:hypothetical protein
MKINEFIQMVLIDQIGEIVRINDYLAFALIFNSIELLGSCFDDKDFGYWKTGYYKKRFTAALKYFPSEYHKLDLCDFGRNGFAHTFKPDLKSKISLSKRSGHNYLDENGNEWPNLSKIQNSKKRILFIEDFYEDFKNVCLEIIKQIGNGTLKHSKFQNDFLPIQKNKLEH